MKDARNIPAIRFKEFSEAWELRKFSEITFSSGVKNKDNLPLESYSITNENGFIPQDEKFENGGTMREADKRMYYIVTPNTFAYNPARINVGSIGYYDKQSNVIVSSLYEVFRTISDVYDRFLWHWFKTAIFQRCIEQLQEGGVRLYFYYDKLYRCSILLPSYEEQKLIGDELDHIDALITLHQRKIDALKTLKKALLAEMFPDNGSDKPLLRFKGFNDAWEQRKLGELMKFQNGYNGSGEDFGISGLPLISVLDILQDQFIDSGNIHSKVNISQNDAERYVVEYGDVLFQRSSETHEDAGRSNVYIDKTCKSVFGGFVIRGKKSAAYSPFFMKYMLDTAPIRRQITSKAQGAQHINVSQDTLSEVTAYLPSLEEQELIGTKLYNIDTFITLHQRKFEGLKTMKTFLLQNMFI